MHPDRTRHANQCATSITNIRRFAGNENCWRRELTRAVAVERQRLDDAVAPVRASAADELGNRIGNAAAEMIDRQQRPRRLGSNRG